jgi:hypothetical protein
MSLFIINLNNNLFLVLGLLYRNLLRTRVEQTSIRLPFGDGNYSISIVSIHEAMKTPKGLAYTVVGSSTLTVEEVV